MRTDTRFLCNLSLISDCNGIALRRKNFFFERQQQHAHVLQKCNFFWICPKAQRCGCKFVGFWGFSTPRWMGLRFNSCGRRFLCETYLLTFLMFEDLGILRMPRVWLWFLGNNMDNSSSIASSCPIGKHQNVLGFVVEISIFQHTLHMVFQNFTRRVSVATITTIS